MAVRSARSKLAICTDFIFLQKVDPHKCITVIYSVFHVRVGQMDFVEEPKYMLITEDGYKSD